MKLAFIVFISLLLLLSSPELKAQFGAALQGIITDSTGGVLPGVSLTLTDTETGRSLTTVSNNEGFYRIGGLAPGNYSLRAELAGFQTRLIEGIQVSAEETTGMNLEMVPAGVALSITVTGPAAVEGASQSANIGRSITSREIVHLPQFGRDPYELARLTPGVFGSGARAGSGDAINLPNTAGPGGSNVSIFAVENQVAITANGQRVSANNYQIDGVNVNSLTWGGAAVVTPNQESISEMRILSSSYSAADGRNSGVQVKVVSRSGGNRISATGFFKYQDPALNAFNKYGGPSAAPVRVTRRFRQFGGSLGGPIVADKLFYFLSYEGLRSNDSEFRTAFVETPEFRHQLAELRPNSISRQIVTAPGVEPRIAQVIPVDCSVFNNDPSRCRVVPGGLDIGSLTGSLGQYLPGDSTGAGFDNVPDLQFVQFKVPRQIRGDQFNPRFDVDVSSHHFALSMYFTRRDDFQSDPGSAARPMADLTFRPLNSAATLIWNSVWSPTILNEARGNFTRFAFDQLDSSDETNFGIPRVEVEGFPFDRIRFGAPRSETTPAVFAQNTFGISEALTVIRGAHAVRFGAQLQWEHNNNNLLGGARPIYSFSGLFNLANDTPIFEAINADPSTGQPIDLQRYFRTSDRALFVQDDWKLTPFLTLNLGLRYEYFSPLTEKEGRLSNLVFGANGLQDSRVVVFDSLYKSDRNNFGPRLGFAWNPPGVRNNLVLRGGFAVFYNRFPTVVFNNVRGNPPFFARYNLCCGTVDNPFADNRIIYSLGANRSPFSYPVNPALAPGIDPETGGPRGVQAEIYGAEPEMPNPYVYIYSLELQRLLPYHLAVSLGYQGSTGHKLLRTVNLNFLRPANPNFFAVYFPLHDINSNYNALNVRLSREFLEGLRFDGIYRWSKSIDYGSGEFGAAANQTYPIELRTERGPSDFDAAHYLVFSALWNLPFFSGHSDWLGKAFGGWHVSSIVTAHSGLPWTPKTGQPIRIPNLAPTRPIQQISQPLDDRGDEAFTRPGGNFPGGGRTYFDIQTQGPPGIGRNSFRGPRYSSADISVIKQISLPGQYGIEPRLEIRANLFNVFNSLNLESFGFFSPGTFIENDFFFGRSERGLAGRVIELQARIEF
ncbi:MAG TPA: TonB-dependent receptor [Acidobacteriota bacterium]|nr:TonB-dependent receptor [Acidobacteriota bacterium]